MSELTQDLAGKTLSPCPAQGMVQQQTGDARWGAHAAAMVAGPMFRRPPGGGHDDKAHPPIHPTRYTAGEANWGRDKAALYEFVVRSFLACAPFCALGFRV